MCINILFILNELSKGIGMLCTKVKIMTVLWLSILVLLTVPQGNNAVHYSFTNQVGGTSFRFDKEITADYTIQVLKNSTNFIWMLFQQSNTADRKNVSTVNLFLENITGIAYTVDNEIYVGSSYIQNYTGDVKTEFTGILFHEMTHVWQWFGNSSTTPGGLIEGIADYVRLKAGYAPSHWVKPGQGDRWDQGYDVTALFLDYCNSLKNGVVAELNKKMRFGYSDLYFVELLGKTAEKLFCEYKDMYNHNHS